MHIFSFVINLMDTIARVADSIFLTSVDFFALNEILFFIYYDYFSRLYIHGRVFVKLSIS